MKKLTTILLALTLSVLSLHAQTTGKWKFEPKLGFNIPLVRYYGKPTTAGMGSEIALELRYNIKDNFDIGVEAFRCATVRETEKTGEQLDDPDYYNPRLVCMMNGIALAGDYTVNRGGTVSFYAGGTIGYSLTFGPVDFASGTLVVTPRCGIELWNRLRIGIESRLSYRYADNIGVTVGYAFGGRPSRRRY